MAAFRRLQQHIFLLFNEIFNAVRNNGNYFDEAFLPQLQTMQVQKHQEDDAIHDVGKVVPISTLPLTLT